MLGRLRQAQHDRLSAPPPTHLSNIPKAPETEVNLAEKITDNLTEIAKKLPPSAIAPVDGLRRAMGIAPVGGGGEPMEVEPITHNPTLVAESTLPSQANLLSNTNSPIQTNILSPSGQTNSSIAPMQIQITGLSQHSQGTLMNTNEAGVPDLESELREFLESDPTLGHSPLHDDKTLEDILSES